MQRGAHRLFTILRVAIALSLLVYLGVSGAIKWSALLGLMRAWTLTPVALLLLFVAMAATAWRLCLLLKPGGLHLSLAAALRLTLIGTFFNACLPGSTGGDVVKIYYAAVSNRGRRTEVVTIMLIDRAVGMFALLLCPLAIAPFFPHLVGALQTLRDLLWITAAVAAAIAAAILIGSAGSTSNSRLRAWVFRWLPMASHAARVLATLQAYRHHAGTLLAAVGISLLAHTMSIGGLLLVAQATDPTAFAWQMSLLIPLGLLANALPVTPGGLGVGEMAFTQLFALAGLRGGAEMLLGWRLLTMLIGLCGLLCYWQGRIFLLDEASPSPEGRPGSPMSQQ